MNIKQLLQKIGDTSYTHQYSSKPTIGQMGITKEKIKLIDKWAKEMTTYGMLALYIPELKKVNKNLTSIAIGDLDGNKIVVGNGSGVKISAQSVIKPFLYLYALEKDVPADKIAGMEATAMPFNTDRILQPELELKVPEHPLNNAGAISSAGEIKNFKDFVEFIRKLTGNSRVNILSKVFESEFEANTNNRALANRLVASGRFKNTKEGDRAYTNYTKACSLGLTVTDVLNASLVLASGGVGIHNNRRLVETNNVVRVLSAMNTYGLYEQSGKIALMVSGARANTSKSGVSGLINNVNPGVGAFVTYSPLLNLEGNSVYGLYAMIPLNNLLALPGGMRLDANGINKILFEYHQDNSKKVHQKIMELVKKGEKTNIFRINKKMLKKYSHTAAY